MYKKIIYPNCELKFDYYIDENGAVWSDKTKKNILPIIDKDGYYRVRLTMSNGKRRNFPVHRLVMIMFNPIINMINLQVNHLDGNKSNNCLDNLEWCTSQENITHAVKTGLRDDRGEKNYFHKITENDVCDIRQLYATGNYTYEQLGKIFNLSANHISRIVRKIAWSHIK